MPDFGSALWNKPTSGETGEGSGGGSSDPVTRSLRLAGSHYLTKTFSNSGNRKTYTIAFWVKRSKISTSSTQVLFSAATSGHTTNSNIDQISFRPNDTLEFYQYPNSQQSRLATAAVYRDVGAWMHCCFSVDTTQATEADRVKIFVNGVLQSVANYTDYPSQNHDSIFNKSEQHKIGEEAIRDRYNADVLLADFYFIDGTALSTPVGNFIEDTGYSSYKPLAFDMSSYSGNSFHIDGQPAHDADLLVTSVGRNDGDTTFVDVAKGHTITKGGDSEHSIAAGNPFTGDDRAIYFDGSSDYLTSTDAKDDANFDNSDWTLEFWINPSNTFGSAIESFMGCGGGTAGWNSTNGHSWTIFAYNVTNQIYFQWWNGSSHVNMAANDDLLPKNTWTHVAVCNQSGTKRFYIGGVQVDTDSNTKAAVSTPSTFNIGVSSALDGKFNGHLYDVSIQRGYCKYEDGTTFTPPTSKITADSNTEFLLQPEKDDSSFEDESSNGHTVSTQGSPTTIASTPYEAAAKSTAIYFDGSGDYLNIGTTSDFRTTTNNFTLDFWFKPDGSSLGTVFSNVNDGNVYDGLTVSVSSVSVSVSLRNSSSSNNVVTLNYTNDDTDWHHVEVSRTGSTLYLFVDGNLEDSGSISFTPTNSGLVARVGRIYASSYPSSNNYAGYLFDYRWSNSGGHTASFTAPTAPLELNPVYLGGDQSGNKNHFTPTGISSHDVMLDTPTTNYCLINPLSETKTDSNNYTPNPTTGLSEGNLKLTSPSIWYNGHGTLGVSSGKWYFEWYSTGDYALGGFSTSEMFSNSNQSITDWWILYNRDSSNNIELRYKDGTSTTGATWAGGSHASGNGNVYGCAFDVDNRKMYFHKNGDWSDGTSTLTSTFPSSYGGDLTGSSHNIPADTTFYPILRAYAPSTVIANFGQDSTFANTVASGSANAADTNGNGDFRYAPPSGYLALCAANLDAPTVTPEEHFNTRLYLGTRDNSTSIGFTSNAVTGVGFKPELLWIKDRDNASSNYGSNYYGNFLFDAVQGTGKAINTDGGMYTGSNDFSSNLDGYNGVSSFDSDGFTVDEAEAVNYAYDSDYNGSLDGYERYVAWGWKLGSNGSSSTWANGNTDPTTEKYNASAGVSVIRQVETSGNYPMTGVTVNHSLGAAPEFAFLADTSGNTQNVYAWHKDLAANKYLRLNANSAQTTGSGYFPSGCSTATTFQIGGDIAGANGYDGWWDIYMYLFTSVEGMVKIGSWVGNGSTDGPMVYCGFRPSLILAKAVNRSNSWYMWDDQRDGYNVTDAGLWADLSGAESHASTNKVDILSNGFKLRGSGNGTNSSSNNNYIFIAWAHSPFSKANSF